VLNKTETAESFSGADQSVESPEAIPNTADSGFPPPVSQQPANSAPRTTEWVSPYVFDTSHVPSDTELPSLESDRSEDL
jgi:hypothetical protein